MIEVESQWWLLAVLAVGMAAVHAWFPAIDARLQRREAMWMGIIGGVAACYVILYLLPKIGLINAKMSGSNGTVVWYRDLTMYYVLLLGVIVYLLMIHLNSRRTTGARIAALFDYVIHGTYAFLLGYVFVELASTHPLANALVALVLGLHLLAMNHLLRSTRTQAYDRIVRWICALLLLAGTVAGLVTEIPDTVVSVVTAFLAGIIMVNVIVEELPLRHQNRVPWFVAGVCFYLGATFLIVSLSS
jgi:hypothetical protein